MFEEALLPRIDELFDEKVEKINKQVKKYRREVCGYRVDVLGFKEEVLGEIRDLRDEVAVTLHQYTRTNKRVDKIATHLNLSV